VQVVIVKFLAVQNKKHSRIIWVKLLFSPASAKRGSVRCPVHHIERGFMQHRGKRSLESAEFRRARQYCFLNCKFDPKRQENVFLGTQENTAAFVCSTVEHAFMADIPDTPQGLVLANNHGEGAFQ
jgi:hypothetical protein